MTKMMMVMIMMTMAMTMTMMMMMMMMLMFLMKIEMKMKMMKYGNEATRHWEFHASFTRVSKVAIQPSKYIYGKSRTESLDFRRSLR